jgi:chitodextrinase
LENTGEYAWRVERYVPARFYIRVEARDTAGNLAAFQTREPVEFSPANLAGRLRPAEPQKSAATHGPDSYR